MKNLDSKEAWERAGYSSEEKYKEYHRAYYLANKQKILANKKKDKISGILRHSKKRAEERGIEHSITREHLQEILTEVCPVFGSKFSSEGRITDESMTLDRIDNSVGYVPGNVMFLSYKANRMKSNASKDDLIAFARYVLKTFETD